jgi:hypothetical protein
MGTEASGSSAAAAAQQMAASSTNVLQAGSQPDSSKPTVSLAHKEVRFLECAPQDEIEEQSTPLVTGSAHMSAVPTSNSAPDFQGVSLPHAIDPIVSDAMLTPPQSAASAAQQPVSAQTGDAETPPDLTEKQLSPKTKIGDSGLRERSALANHPVWENQNLSKTQSHATESRPGSSGDDRDANERPTQSQQSDNANAAEGNTSQAPRSAGLAFSARLVPIPETPVVAADPDTSVQSPHTPSADHGAGNASHSSGGAAQQNQKESPKSDPPGDGLPASQPSSSQSEMVAFLPQPASGQSQNNSSSAARPDHNSAQLRAATDVQAAEPGTEAHLSAASPARDIHLQLNQGDQRVDVRLSERSGEVHVAVRTPDPELAGALRDDLPRLSDRLEQSGFRAETWHTALSETPAGGERRLEAAESSFSNPQESGQKEAQQENQQQQQQQQRQPRSGAPQNSNSQRKDFQWLMSQLP